MAGSSGTWAAAAGFILPLLQDAIHPSTRVSITLQSPLRDLLLGEALVSPSYSPDNIGEMRHFSLLLSGR